MNIYLPGLLVSFEMQLQDGIVIEHVIIQHIKKVIVVNAAEYDVAKLGSSRFAHSISAPFMT